MIEYIETDKAPAAFGPFSQALKSEQLVFTSGALPLVPLTGELVVGGIKEQTVQTLENLKAVLKEAGSSLEQVMLITVYMTDMDEFSEMNEVYATYFGKNCPARAAVGINALAKKARVEMQAVAVC